MFNYILLGLGSVAALVGIYFAWDGVSKALKQRQTTIDGIMGFDGFSAFTFPLTVVEGNGPLEWYLGPSHQDADCTAVFDSLTVTMDANVTKLVEDGFDADYLSKFEGDGCTIGADGDMMPCVIKECGKNGIGYYSGLKKLASMKYPTCTDGSGGECPFERTDYVKGVYVSNYPGNPYFSWSVTGALVPAVDRYQAWRTTQTLTNFWNIAGDEFTWAIGLLVVGCLSCIAGCCMSTQLESADPPPGSGNAELMA